MKKRIALVLTLTILISTFGFSGCTAFKAVDTAKEAIIEFYDYYNDEDIDECVEMFGSEIIDDFDGEDLAEIVFNSRRHVLGEVEEFDVISFDSEGSFNEARVVLEIETQYENEDDVLVEQFVIHVTNDDTVIIGIDFEEFTVLHEMLDDYFKKYDNVGHIKDLYIPYYVDNFFAENELSTWADNAKTAGGEYKSHEFTDHTSYFDELSWGDDIYLLSVIEGEMKFEKDDFYLYAEVSSEDGEIGFNYIEYYPLSIYKTLDMYYNALEQKDTDKMMEIYIDNFFEGEDFTAADWEESILSVLANDFGSYIGYNVYSFEAMTLNYRNRDWDVYSVVVATEFENALFEEDFVFIIGEENKPVIGHQIYDAN